MAQRPFYAYIVCLVWVGLYQYVISFKKSGQLNVKITRGGLL